MKQQHNYLRLFKPRDEETGLKKKRPRIEFQKRRLEQINDNAIHIQVLYFGYFLLITV